MSRLIKARGRDEPARVRALEPLVVFPGVAAAPSEGDLLRQQLERRDQELLLLREENERLVAAVAEARREGEAAGRIAGLQEADRQASEALRRLEAGIAAAVEALSGRLVAMDRLAAQLAHNALERVFDDAERSAEQVRSALRRQLSQLEASSVLGVDVSAADFPASSDLQRLQAALGTNVEIAGRTDLCAGDCHIRLTLGGLEVGPRQQWRRLSQLLDALSEPAE